MRAVVLEEHGEPEVLQIKDVPDPAVGAEEVLVRVATTALNRADLLQRRGLYPGPKMDHEIPGMEFSGTVEAVGGRVTEHQVGDPVMGIVGAGGLGRLLAAQTAAFDEPAMVTTILALLAVAIATDLVGTRLRAVTR